MRGRLFYLLLLGVAAALVTAPARALPASLPVRTTFHDARYDGVVGQTDWSTCGPAAVATLLRYYYGMDVDEREALRRALSFAEAQGLDAAAGVSGLALAHSMETFGVPTLGYRLTPEALTDYFHRGGLPVIAHVTRPRQHYVVLVGMIGPYVLVADPSWGRRVERWDDFLAEKDFSGVTLVPVPDGHLASIASEAQRRAVQRLADTVWGLSALGWSVRRP